MGKTVYIKTKLRGEEVGKVELFKACHTYRGVGLSLYTLLKEDEYNKGIRDIEIRGKTYTIVILVNSEHVVLIPKEYLYNNTRLGIYANRVDIGYVVGTSGKNVKLTLSSIKEVIEETSVRYINVSASKVDISKYLNDGKLTALMAHIEYTKEKIRCKTNIDGKSCFINNDGLKCEIFVNGILTYEEIREDWDLIHDLEFDPIIDVKTGKPFMVTEL